MSERTSLLFGLNGYRVFEVTEAAAEGLRVLIETVDREAGCPSCGVFSASVKDRPERRLRDLPCGDRPAQVWLKQRRLECLEPLCERQSFTMTTEEIPARASPAEPREIRSRLWDFYAACTDADMPETTRLAGTIEQWWPTILTFLLHRVSNARTEGFNRITKQVRRACCGYRNMDNYKRRILTHIAVTRAA